MNYSQSGGEQHTCIVNVGLFRSGTTTLAMAAESLGLNSYRKFPELSPDELKEFLEIPETSALDWLSRGEMMELIWLALKNGLICDGWIALLPFLTQPVLESLKHEAGKAGVRLEFVATSRDIEATVDSELHHWTIHGLERRADLSLHERGKLESHLRDRAVKHNHRIHQLEQAGILKILPLSNIGKAWSETLSSISTHFTPERWEDALRAVGKQNTNPRLPVEGILLTLRLGEEGKEANDKIASVERLLGQIEEDSICRYLVVLAIDTDEEDGNPSIELAQRISSRPRLHSLHQITNPAQKPGQPFAICSVWHEMAAVAWKNGADWVVLLGDDIKIDCRFHYRAIYRSFLDIAERLNLEVPFDFFGCPWWNDNSFPGFPTFPCVGKAHYKIFGGLIPEPHCSRFVNQDLDPYLHRLYIKFMAAPCIPQALLFNGAGGSVGSGDSRYERVPAQGWQTFAQDDIEPIRKYLPEDGVTEAILLDVVVPSYRVRLDYLQSICALKVPENFRTLFIIVVDNPEELLSTAARLQKKSTDDTSMTVTLSQGERILEAYLSQGGNIVRVRCNTTNLGASASRNRGLDESAAEFVLNLDDDLVPRPDLLEQYGRKLQDIDDDVVGLVGLVRFPRSSKLPLRHAAVLMSYLTFMFEIAECKNMYANNGPAWGVTANILFRRTNVRFDPVYAKTGGGEDVDFSLSVAEASNGGKLLMVPEACVVHPFWPGSVFTLSRHFFNWAIGDGALFLRFPKYCYWSWPNVPEMLFLLSPLSLWLGPWKFLRLVPAFLAADLVVDMSNRTDYRHRCHQLKKGGPELEERSALFCFAAHCLGNLYVVALECGRLWGHMARKNVRGGLCHRFDWHCGRLQNAPANFRKREAYKFGLFVGILAFEIGGARRQWSGFGSCSTDNSWKDLVAALW
jgi:glycosyltransferase involved in cell wall biosynthesis